MVRFFSWRLSMAFCTIFACTSTVMRPGCKPDCSGGIMAFSAAHLFNFFVTSASRVFEIPFSCETGLSLLISRGDFTCLKIVIIIVFPGCRHSFQLLLSSLKSITFPFPGKFFNMSRLTPSSPQVVFGLIYNRVLFGQRELLLNVMFHRGFLWPFSNCLVSRLVFVLAIRFPCIMAVRGNCFLDRPSSPFSVFYTCVPGVLDESVEVRFR